MIRQLLTATGVVALVLGCKEIALAIDCPTPPEQISNDYSGTFDVIIGKLRRLSGAELGIEAKRATHDLLGKLPGANQVYLEQMFFAAYCSSVRDDKALSESRKGELIKEYRTEFQRATDQHKSSEKQPTSVASPSEQPKGKRRTETKADPSAIRPAPAKPKQKDEQQTPLAPPKPNISQHSEGANSPNIVGNQNVVTINPIRGLPEQDSTDQDNKKLYFECDFKALPKTIPPGGLRAVMFRPGTPDIHSLHEITEFGNPGDANRFVNPERYGIGGAAFMCHVTNYGKNPILKIDLPFELEFREAVGGNVKFVTTWPARIRKLEPNGTYDFYLLNDSEHILNISLPIYADSELLGEYQSRKVKLSNPYTYDGKHAVQYPPVKLLSSTAK